MSNLLNRLAERRMPQKDVRICLDLTLLAERDNAMADVARIRRQQDADQRMVVGPDLARARAAVADIEDRIKHASIVLRITGVDRTTYNRYVLECPPRKGRQESFDSSRFFMHVARETATYVDENGDEHPMNSAEWEAIDKQITDGEHDRIAEAVIEVNRTVGGTDIAFLSDGSATTRDSFGISASPGASESHPADSGDGNPKKPAPSTSTPKATDSPE